MNKKYAAKSVIWLAVGIGLSALSGAAINSLQAAGADILTMGSRGQVNAATLQYFAALGFLYAVLAAGVAMIIVAVRNTLKSFKK